jgi:hypothetical protein
MAWFLPSFLLSEWAIKVSSTLMVQLMQRFQKSIAARIRDMR